MAELTAHSRVATFPAHISFIDALAAHVLGTRKEDTLDPTILFLPSRRAATALRDACLRLTDGRPLLLPRVFPLGDVDESEWFFEAVAENAPASHLPPPVSRTQRHVMLTRHVAQYLDRLDQKPKANMEEAALLALELAELLDEVEREELKLSDLRDLVPAELALHWEETLGFMRIISRDWPAQLEAMGAIEPAAHRALSIRALAKLWESNPPKCRVIAAGSTGSQPATAALLAAVARLPQGLVILPALDVNMPKEAWREVDEVHPQYNLKRLLEHLDVTREQVAVMGQGETELELRAEVLQAALLPASFTHGWKLMHAPPAQALAGLSRVEAANGFEEARTIALLLRGVLEQPGKRAALVTHDRTLARMVAAEMQRFGTVVDDSAGRGVAELPVAVFVQLVAEMASSRAAPVALLAMLKHPFAGMGMDTAQCRSAARELEVQLLRGVRSAKGFAAMKRALARREEVTHETVRLIERLEQAGDAFIAAFGKSRMAFADLLELHLACAEACAATDDESGAKRLWSGDQGNAAAEAFADVRTHARELPPIDPQNYAALLDVLLSHYSYRPPYGQHPRLAILSPIEARLQHFDMVILGGLNEGSWPPVVQASPWMSRPMQKAFGLPGPERQVGMAAHDFVTLACAKEVVLTRALKSGGALTSPARWLRRLDTMLSALTGAPYAWETLPEQHWARELIAPEPAQPLAPPRPRPPLSARPRDFSVSDIDRWLRDPYGLYAAKVLALKPLEPIDKEPGASEFGTLLHRAMQLFTERFPAALPADAKSIWMECAAEAFRAFEDRPAVRAFWWRRIDRIADWLMAREAVRRPLVSEVQAEWKGERVYSAAGGDVRVKTRIDRIERRADGTIAVGDYKTGAAPTDKAVRDGLAVQLPLEASIMGEGRIAGLEYWSVAGRKYELNIIADSESEAREIISIAESRLNDLIVAYDDPEMPYLAVPLPQLLKSRFNDYEHLERKDEWET